MKYILLTSIFASIGLSAWAMDSAIIQKSPLLEHQSAVENTRKEQSDLFDAAFSVIALSSVPLVIKTKGLNQDHFPFLILFKDKENGQLVIKLIIATPDNTKISCEANYNNAVSSLNNYIKSQVPSDNWHGVITLTRTLLSRCDNPLWTSLLIKCVCKMFSRDNVTELIAAIELNEDGRLNNWLDEYITLSAQKNFDLQVHTCAANTTALISAVRKGLGEIDAPNNIIQRLIVDAHACMNQSNSEGDTPLMFASLDDQIITIEYLIRAGALIDKQNNKGLTALHIACAAENPRAVANLLNHKADTETISRETGFTPLLTAIYCKNAEIVNLLLNSGANPNVMVNSNNTALMLALTNYGSLMKCPLLIDEYELENAKQVVLHLLADSRTNKTKQGVNGLTFEKLAKIYNWPVESEKL